MDSRAPFVVVSEQTGSSGAGANMALSSGARVGSGANSWAEDQCVAQTHKMATAITGSAAAGSETSKAAVTLDFEHEKFLQML